MQCSWVMIHAELKKKMQRNSTLSLSLHLFLYLSLSVSLSLSLVWVDHVWGKERDIEMTFKMRIVDHLQIKLALCLCLCLYLMYLSMSPSRCVHVCVCLSLSHTLNNRSLSLTHTHTHTHTCTHTCTHTLHWARRNFGGLPHLDTPEGDKKKLRKKNKKTMNLVVILEVSNMFTCLQD